MRTCFIADGTAVYGITATGRIHIADTDSESWAETIAEALSAALKPTVDSCGCPVR